MSDTPKQAVLCYVDGPWAYFTTRKLSEQWGDDWDDAPYEHNAGRPYDYSDHDRKEGRESWEIIKVAWDGDFEAPCDNTTNSRWSVERINAGGVAWLQTSQWSSSPAVIIPAGVTIERFAELIKQGGGSIYTLEP
jgi:hypothetical protein